MRFNTKYACKFKTAKAGDWPVAIRHNHSTGQV